MRTAAVILAITAVACCVVLAFTGCGPSTPTPAQQAGVGLYEAALQGCIAQAKLTDSGLAGYQSCAAKADAQYRYGDGGAQ